MKILSAAGCINLNLFKIKDIIPMGTEFFNRLKKIKAFAFDIDGVLTDGTLHITDEGQMLRTMHIKDGLALAKAVQAGYHICAISGSNSPGMKIRLAKLGVDDVVFDHLEKLDVFRQFIAKHNLSSDEVIFMGDDVIDIPPMQEAGIGVCPADAVRDVIEIAGIVTSQPGGKGAVREIIELVMKVQGKEFRNKS
jgi:3-deoxy-D-manno-octulosonate 8-phosphate phosphatase (KDO 8-P phosphatase)